MYNFNLDEFMDLAEAYVGPMVDAIYRRLMDRDFALEDPEVVMLLTALINILGHDNRRDRPIEVLLMAAYGERGVLDRPNMRVMRWRNGALSGSDLAKEPGLGSSRTYQPGEMPLPSKPKPGLRRMHQEMNSEVASSSSPLIIAVPPKLCHQTTATWDITSFTWGHLGQSAPKFEDLQNHHGDGVWRRIDSPVSSDGGADEPREHPSRNGRSRDKQHLEKLR